MRKIIERCPACGRTELTVTILRCPDCGTEVHGAFVASRFCRLAEPSLEFLEMFVRNRGNLKEMERELGIAYTTLRNRLNEIIHEMGYEAKEDEPGTTPGPPPDSLMGRRRQVILERLRNGEITPDEAVQALRRL